MTCGERATREASAALSLGQALEAPTHAVVVSPVHVGLGIDARRDAKAVGWNEADIHRSNFEAGKKRKRR